MKPFTFEVFNYRYGSTLSYDVTKTESGWYIHHIAINGDCDKEGSPYFYSNFNQDNIAYPKQFGTYLAYLWADFDLGERSHDDAQTMLQELADWVSTTEKSQPSWPEWNGRGR